MLRRVVDLLDMTVRIGKKSYEELDALGLASGVCCVPFACLNILLIPPGMTSSTVFTQPLCYVWGAFLMWLRNSKLLQMTCVPAFNSACSLCLGHMHCSASSATM